LAASIDAIEHGDALRTRLALRIARLRKALADLPATLLPSTTAIQALVVGGNDAAMALSARLLAQRILVPAIRPPTVPPGTARLRISLTAAHDDDDVDELAGALRRAC
ncbi:MAG TPA: aminotransferase class I/II-fold pyridoxal phosphate-dependent enzyme, partial [Candidatus Saccharimonadia bacterium]|nr:aminotransferase class I/II-fold pyridoxal phosphate-dependent enzyme [Candidatus Saccharimonadia bacterium]